MIVDDRLDTVLRTQTAGRAGLNTQWRQLVDLLGRLPDAHWSDSADRALYRLGVLHGALGDAAAGVLTSLCTIRQPRLVAHLATLGPRTALAAITRARLDDAVWLALIPALPVQARGALRHRRDLGAPVVALLDRLGIGDFVLTAPAETAPETAANEPAGKAAPGPGAVLMTLPVEQAARDDAPARDRGGIGAIVRRIEAFRQTRAAIDPAAPGQPRLPFAEDTRSAAPLLQIDCLIDATGMIVAVEGADPATLVGHRPFVPSSPAAAASADPASCDAYAMRRPVMAGSVWFDGAPAIAGHWRIDAEPRFAAHGGAFAGYAARLRRSAAMAGQHGEAATELRGADQLHQVLHELRTPINAVQGFAELIQQQLLGQTPHHYRALAAAIASDAARMLAGFEDVERLIQLESGRRDTAGDPARQGDLALILARVHAQLAPSIERRAIALDWSLPDGPIIVAMPLAELERTVWRLVSTLIGASAPGETMTLGCTAGAAARLTASLPASLGHDTDDLFAPDITTGAAADASLLGNGFALRLCRAEARAAGGMLDRPAGRAQLVLTLPLAPAVALDRDAVAS